MIGNDYVVLDGLKEGDTLIVSGVQKVGDGASVAAGATRRAGNAHPQRKRAQIVLSDVFIRRPVLATVCSLFIMLAGAICDSHAADRRGIQSSRRRAVSGHGLLHRRQRASRGERGDHAARSR